MAGCENSWVPGWYGKIPSLGDFASRRLPTSFINSWDSWVQDAISTSRKQLGKNWLDIYLTGPILRFVLMPGVCGDRIWAGILMPSVDKVGRYFPLTFAIQIASNPTMMSATLSAQTWYASLEHIALNALNINIGPDDIDQQLFQHPFPVPHTSGSSIPPVKELSSWWQEEALAITNTHRTLSLANTDLLPGLFDSTANELLFTAGLGKSIWWKVSSEDATTQVHCFLGLPSGNHFVTLLQNHTE